jgi:DNA-directed RNA polymerase omega subunit
MEEIYFSEDVSGEEVNPYEAVTLAAQIARKNNQKRVMDVVQEAPEKPTSHALRMIAAKKVVLRYEEAEEELVPEDEEAEAEDEGPDRESTEG